MKKIITATAIFILALFMVSFAPAKKQKVLIDFSNVEPGATLILTGADSNSVSFTRSRVAVLDVQAYSISIEVSAFAACPPYAFDAFMPLPFNTPMELRLKRQI